MKGKVHKVCACACLGGNTKREEARWKRREMETRRRRRRRGRPRRSRRDDDSNNIARGDAVTTSSLPLVQTRPTTETTGPAASVGAGVSALWGEREGERMMPCRESTGRREVSGFYSSLGRTREKKYPFVSFYTLLSAPPNPLSLRVCRTFRRLSTFVAFTDFVVAERLSFVGETWFFVKTTAARGRSVVY